jgi:hypothetical protein
MYCESCGNFVPDGQAFCANCGAPQPKTSAPVTQAAPVAAQPVVQPVVQPVYQQPVYTSPAPTVIVQQPAVAAAATPVAKPEPKKGNGPATAGLVFGILTFIFSFASYFVSLFALLGLIFSIIGLCKKAPGKGKAIAGLILTVLGVISAVLFTIFFWAAAGVIFDSFMNDIESEIEDEFYLTSYSDTNDDNNEYSIDGNFATTEKGYATGVLHIDGFRVEF